MIKILLEIKADGTETFAISQSEENDRLYKLYGYKWFSSATDADMTITLARVCDQNNNVIRFTLKPIIYSQN
jgi:hypothetical protein